MSYLSQNIDLLRAKNPDLAEVIEQTSPELAYVVELAKSGRPTLTYIDPAGRRINLNSTYDPEKEAVSFINSQNLENSLNYIVTGFGLGYHLIELVNRVSQNARILVFEKNLHILRLAFEHNDLSDLIKHSGLSIYPSMDSSQLAFSMENVKMELAVNGYTTIVFKPLIEMERIYYETLDKTFQQILKEAEINIKSKSVFSRTYYMNFLENLADFVVSPGIGEMKNKLKGVPAILVSAGPSLDKNMALLKTVKGKSIMIAVATALRPLLSNGITPDFTAAIDPDDTSIKYFDLNSTDSSTKLLFDSCLPPTIVQSFQGKRITFDSSQFISKWIAGIQGSKGQIGKSLSVAHTGYLFAKHLGCEPIILTGQDLAFLNNRLHCRNSWFESEFLNATNFGCNTAELRNIHFLKYRNALISIPDIFGGKTQSTTAMESYKYLFLEEFKNSTVYNATEGGSNIPGTTQISLREALSRFCYKSKKRNKAIFLSSNKKQLPTLELKKGLKQQIATFEKWRDDLDTIKEALEERGNEIFVTMMEDFYEDFLKKKESVRLIQEYAYEGFLQWNRSNHQIMLLENNIGKGQILKLKSKRDREFQNVLLKSLEGLIEMFKRAYEQIKKI